MVEEGFFEVFSPIIGFVLKIKILPGNAPDQMLILRSRCIDYVLFLKKIHST